MSNPRDIPAEGTYLRQLYDSLKENKGKPVRLEYRTDVDKKRAQTYQSSSLEQLRNFYGCVIRKVDKHIYVLEGEWIGNRYHDYKESAA